MGICRLVWVVEPKRREMAAGVGGFEMLSKWGDNMGREGLGRTFKSFELRLCGVGTRGSWLQHACAP